jgi:MFS family permease
VGFAAYRTVLGIQQARFILALGLLIRIPMWAANIVLTLHVVAGLDRSYSEAGLVTMASTVALAISAPWRGRLLDRRGLRATVAPQLVILALVWSVAPFVGYWLLLPLAVVGGLFIVPTFSIVRQVLITAVEDRHRTAALSLDSLATEISFMVGPVLGVLGATFMDTAWALCLFEMAAVAGGALVWLANPKLINEADETGEQLGWHAWMSPMVFAVLGAAVACTVVLYGTDIGVVAALRDMGHQSSIGWVLAVWGLGSAVGAVVYGALRTTVPVFVLLALLAGSTVPVVLADDRFTLAVLLFVCGMFCAPTITATIDSLSRVVPPQVRGEVMGWHGSALTLGGAIGAPMAGFAIDQGGWEAAFLVTALAALTVALVGMFLLAGRARRVAA